ncbi:MAG: hypothetical protein ILP10_00860 [Lachnospiraceae bacterium]|nr:hypothetical protein [Lachnospiraceae bacterium]
MSNIIKAYGIRYDETTRNLDMNERAEECKEQFIKMDLARKKEEASFVPLTAEDGTPIEGIEDAGEVEPEISPEEEELSLIMSQIEENKQVIADQEAHIEELKHQADLVFENAKKEAERTIAQANLNANKARIEIFEKAKVEGYEAGAEKAREELEAAQAQLNETEAKLREDYEKQVRGLEPAFIEMLIKYIEKITTVLLEDRKDILASVIDRFIMKQESASTYIIRVPAATFAQVKEREDEIRSVVGDAALEIYEDKVLTDDKVMIECDGKLFDISPGNDLEGLIFDLKLLAMKD